MSAETETFNSKVIASIKSSLKDDETITTIAGTPSELFLGTNQGRIVHVKTAKNGSHKVFGVIDYQLNFPIVQLDHASALNLLLSVCNNTLYEIELEEFKVVSSRPNVIAFCLNSNPVVDDPFSLQMAIATTNKQILVAQKQGNNINVLQKITTEAAPVSIEYSKYSICFATSDHYYMYHTLTRHTLPLFPIAGSVVTPYICAVDSEEFLLNGMDGLAIFVTGKGMSTRPPAMINAKACALVYRDPFILYLAANGIGIVNTLCSKSNMEDVVFPNASALRFLDGSIFAANDESLLMLKQDTFEDQLEKLMSNKKFAEAIALYEKKISDESFREELMMEFRYLRLRVGLSQLDDNDFESAATMLEESQVEATEIIPLFAIDSEVDASTKRFSTDDHLAFLKEYLLNERTKDSCSCQNVVDTALLKLFMRDRKLEELDSLVNFSPDSAEATRIYKANGHFSRCADFLWRHGSATEALDLWKQLAVGDMKDDEFSIDYMMQRVNCLSDMSTLQSVLIWMTPLRPEECLEVMLQHKSELDYEVVSDLLKDLPQLEAYLESLPYSISSGSKLAKIYVAKTENGDESMRGNLRTLLFQLPSTSTAELDLSADTFITERLIRNAESDPAGTLDKLLNEMHDLDTAEKLCARYSDSHPQLGISLLEKYLNIEKSDPAVSERIGRLLSSLGKYVDGPSVINKLPQDMPLQQVSGFLANSLTHQQSALNMSSMRSALLKTVKPPQTRDENGYVKLTDSSECAVCGLVLNYDDGLTHLKTGYIVHTKCMRHPNLCPVTNTVLF